MKINLPAWLQRSKLQLPEWASVDPHTPKGTALHIAVDTDKAMREWLGLLGSPPIDQYWLEVAFQCVKLDCQMALAGTEYDPRINAKPAQFTMNRAEHFAQKKHPVGKGAAQASQGKEARGHYIRIRGNLPM